MSSKKVRVLPWPSRSLDLKPVENEWVYLTRRVYAHGDQFGDVAELEKTIYEKWDALPKDYLLNFIESMAN